MNKNELVANGLAELSEYQLNEVNGGIIHPFFWTVVGCIPYLYDNRDKVIEGFKSTF